MKKLKLLLIGANLIPPVLVRRRLQKELSAWKQGRGRYPNLLKQSTVLDYARQHSLRTLVETGTYYGEMIRAVLHSFDRVYSIEIEPHFYRRARKVFAGNSHVSILHGNSADLLPNILRSISDPSLFWLDAHYCGGLTGIADTECPTATELKAIFAHPLKHVILIDDASFFTGDNGYPTLAAVEEMATANKYSFAVKDEIIRLV
jgi:hypothetical protein